MLQYRSWLICFGAASVLGMALVPSADAATIVADFTDGNTTAAVDGYEGQADPGVSWATPWSLFTQGGIAPNVITRSATVNNTSPLNGNGNYLSVSYEYTTLGGVPSLSNAGARRQFDNAVVNTEEDYTLTFLFRIDTSSGFDSITDRIHLRGSNFINSGFNTTGGWQVDWKGDGGWRVYDGNGTGGVAQTLLTGISGVEGTVYELTVDVRASENEWDFTISDGIDTVVATDLGFRNDGSPGSPNWDSSYLGFVANGDAQGDSVTFSIDSIAITNNIPEPGTLGLLAIGGLMIFVRRHK